MKRLFDIILSAIGLICISPIFLIISLLVKSGSKGPLFYRGERVGLNGVLFKINKFRTMRPDAEKVGGSSTSENDPRITAIGRILRKYKIDEIPQLINVLLGEMSFVGPRPEVKYFTDMYTEQEKIILTVRPGITDYASIEYNNEGEIIKKSGYEDYDLAYQKFIRPGKIQLQLKYIKEQSLLTDLKIIFKTVRTLFVTRTIAKSGRNGYQKVTKAL